MELKKINFNKEKKFFDQLDKESALVLLSQLSASKGTNSCVAPSATIGELDLLIKIQTLWKSGFEQPDHCLKMFTQRSWHQKKLDYLVFYYNVHH